MERNEPDEATKAELIKLGAQLMAALEPFVKERPGLELVLCYAIPHGPDGQRATSLASTITNLQDLVCVYARAGAGLVQLAMPEPH